MATVPFNYGCDRDYAFTADPNEHKRFGYITELDGFGLAGPAVPDLTLSVPFVGQPAYPGITLKQPSTGIRTVNVVGVLENFAWPGGVGDAINLEFWCSQENAVNLKSVQQSVLKNTTVKGLAWWIADYDQETKRWFELSFPTSSLAVRGLLAGKDNPELNVDLTPVAVKDGIDVNVFKVSISVAPAANAQYGLHFANSATTQVAKSWGLIVGTLASGSVTPS